MLLTGVEFPDFEQMLISSIPLESLTTLIENAPSAVLIAEGQQLVLANPAALELFVVTSFPDLCIPGRTLFHSDTDRTPLNLLLAAWAETTWKQTTLRVCATRGESGKDMLLVLNAWRIALEGRPAVQIELRPLSPQEQVVVDEEAELVWVMEMTSQVAWTADPQGNITNFSNRWLELTGLSKEEAIGSGWQTVPHPDDLPRMATAWQHALTTGDTYEVEHRICIHTGEYQCMRSQARPRRNRSGDIVRWYGSTEDISERKNAEALSQLNEEVAGLALESAHFGVWQLDLITRQATRSLLHDRIFGYPEALPEWTLEMFLGHVEPEDRPKVEASFANAAAEERDWEFEARIRRTDGKLRWIWANGHHFRDETGVPARLVGLVADITERRTREQLIQESEARSNRILQSIGDAVIVADAGGLVTRMNPVAENLTGWSEAEARGIPLDRVFAISEEKTGRLMEGPLHKVMRKEAVVGLATNAVLVRRDWSVIHIDDSAAPVLNEADEVLGVVLVFRNIDERRSGELVQLATLADLKQSEENLRIAAEVTRLGLTRLDPATETLLSCTDLFKANFGRAPEDPFLYADLLASIHPDDLPNVQRAIQKAVREEVPYQAEYRVTWPDGSLHWIHARGQLLKFDDGRRPEIEGVILDVTERHQAQNALLQSEKLAAVGKLAASIAHEINNPLESVTNLLYLATGSESLEEVQGYLRSADVELRRVSAITSQTLRFHRQSTRPREVTASDMFESVLSIYHGKLVNSKVQVKQRFRAQSPISCFEGEIRQVLNNLVANAVDVLHPDGGHLFVRSRNATCWKTGRQGIVFTVADSGPGMEPHIVAKAFDAFYTTKGIGGTGLGLWLGKEIAARHHGNLQFRSSNRKKLHGTVFTLFLPFDAVTRER